MKNVINSILGRYHSHPEAMIVSCFFNPKNSPYRLKAFKIFLESISHLNYRIIECVIGDSKPQLELSDKITRVQTESLLWHKETLLNKVIKSLPQKYRYIFWIDADVIFKNKKWITDGVKAMQNGANIIQPFEYCVHLDQDESKPSFNLNLYKNMSSNPYTRHPSVWRSFCSNMVERPMIGTSDNYDIHGHVGFAWAAKREILDRCPLYEKALIGGADHIIAHAAAGQIPHRCINKAFIEDMDAVNEWSKKFYRLVRGKIGYVKGDLYHIWHGDVNERQYLKRIREFTKPSKSISQRDENGFYVNKDKELDKYVGQYFDRREVSKNSPKPKSVPVVPIQVPKKNYHVTDKRSSVRHSDSTVHHSTTTHHTSDDGFGTSFAIGYMTNNAGLGMLGGNPAGAILGEMMNTSEENHTHSSHNSHHSTNVEHCDTPSHHHNHDGPNCSIDHHSDSDTSSNFS